MKYKITISFGEDTPWHHVEDVVENIEEYFEALCLEDYILTAYEDEE